MYFWNEDFVQDRLGRQQLRDFEVMDEELIVLVVEGKVEVDQFVDVEVLQS